MQTSAKNVPPAKVMLSVNDFCASAGIGRSTFYEEIKIGRIKVKKCGKRTLVPISELEDWPRRLPDPNDSQVA